MSDLLFSMEDLQGRTYRDLQQLAKSLGLPSNVKKIYLIQLIHAKKYSTPAEVETIVARVKLERKNLAQVRKRAPKKGPKKTNLQLSEISSTSNSQSPPISHTPKRPGHIIVPCSEVRHTIVKYPRQSMIRSTYIKKTYPSPVPTTSDRVLRSFSLKPKQNQNSILSIFKEENPTALNEARMDIMSKHKVYPKANALAKCLVRKQRPQMQSRSASLVERLRGQLLPMATSRMNSCPHPASRQRVLSGIYPITTKVTKETPKVNYEYIQSIGFRRSDGTVSRINALVQKVCNEQPQNLEVTVQDLIDSNIDSQQVQSLEYPNMSSVTDYSHNYQRQRSQFEVPDRSYPNQCIDDSVYYHKKIRAEQVRSQRTPSVREERGKEKLPNINEVFTRFNDVQRRDVTQPIYVQVSDESERILNYPLYVGRNSASSMLEGLYNFKGGFLLHQPLLQVATVASTRCVYSTPVIASAVAHTSSLGPDYNASSCERDSQTSLESELEPRMYDYFKISDPDVSARRDYRTQPVEELNTSDSSIERPPSQGVESSATIPEMVEDALEIISQDGDYMERIGVGVRVQCILCSWAGPRFILEYHIRKDHASLVLKSEQSEWSLSFPLGCVLRSQFWTSRVVAYDTTLYVLSIKYEDFGCYVSLSALSTDPAPKTGYLTVYNKLTGEPHTWTGEIHPLSPNLPYYTEASCLKLDISRLDLIPSSANLKLVNRELVVASPNKVIVGRPDLDEIYLTVFVKILNTV